MHFVRIWPAFRIPVACNWPASGLLSACLRPALRPHWIRIRPALALLSGQLCLHLRLACIQPVLATILSAYSLSLACTGLNLACISSISMLLACTWSAFGQHVAPITGQPSASIRPAFGQHLA
jgi:hypothetical protein